MKSAIIGLGGIANVHVATLKELGHEIVCVCDIDIKKAQDFVQKHGISPKIYDDYTKMLENESIDVVHICTPHYLHAPMIVCALNKNINVLTEKPLCISEEQLKEIEEAKKSSKSQLGVCHQNRYNSCNLYVKEYLKDKNVTGGFGSVLWFRNKDYYDSGEWRGKALTEGGGVMINQALHTLDLMQWFSKMPTEVNADTYNITHPYIEVEDTARARFAYDGETFEFYASLCQNTDFPVSITLSTEKENIFITNGKVIINGKIRNFKNKSLAYAKNCYGDGHIRLIYDYYDCIKTGRKFEIDEKEGAKVVKMILAMYKSHGKNIKI